jgi:hypothetical protein
MPKDSTSGICKLLGKMQVPKTLCLKKSCPVMLVKNLSKSLVNGMQGTVLELKENTVTVKFENIVTDVKWDHHLGSRVRCNHLNKL